MQIFLCAYGGLFYFCGMNEVDRMPEKKWYALYTKSRNEKKVAERLREKGITVYLPLQQTLKQWSDRRKKVWEPLFKSYLFVYTEAVEHYRVLQTDGVVCFITIGGELISIPENQIMAIKHFLQETKPTESLTHFSIGDRVCVVQGSMYGVEGEIIDFSGKHKVRIQIEGINQVIDLSIPASMLTRV
ncbi:MAG: UpxY family transcription antiterminator [Bacteroidetes bacterium]|jgi:transcription antitermination factor NusG|nr:UpxY family transcription antiterminator [Bacteroidota bacterium]